MNGTARNTAMRGDAEGCWAVSLVDRRTGRIHRRNGSPLSVLTSDPKGSAEELLKGRDPTLWQARIDPLPQGAVRSARAGG